MVKGFVNGVDGVRDSPKVLNGASEFLLQVLGDAGGLADFTRAFSRDAIHVDLQAGVDGLDTFAAMTRGVPRKTDNHADDAEVHRDGTDPTFSSARHLSASRCRMTPSSVPWP